MLRFQSSFFTTQVGCPPHYDDMLLGTLPGVAGQRVAHCPLPLFGWQATVQVQTGVYVCCRVQLQNTKNTNVSIRSEYLLHVLTKKPYTLI